MATIKLSRYGLEFIGTVDMANEVRQEIEEAINNGENVVVDCEGIVGISGVFAFNAFAKLLENISLKDFLKYVKFNNCNDVTLAIIRAYISSFLQRKKEEIK